jgi:SAM-dependent methyltransferase
MSLAHGFRGGSGGRSAPGQRAEAAYDTIGRGYTRTRRSDPRIFAQIVQALGNARTVVNVGAGTGSYEPDDRAVVAVERSMEMIRQRPSHAAPVLQGDATHLPFPDGSFDAALAVLTIHHWPDVEAGLAEMKRVAPSRIVISTHTIVDLEDFWLTRDYFPETIENDHKRFPTIARIKELVNTISIETIPVPRDCKDGFLGAFWSQPEAYLDPDVRAGMSSFPMLAPEVVDERIAQLERDIASGLWDERNGYLRSLDEVDLGYRLIVAKA